VNILQTAFDKKEFTSNYDKPILFEDIRSDDRVRYSRFILEAEKHESFCCSRTLSRDDCARNSHVSTIANVREIDGAQHSHGIHLLAIVGHRVWTYGHAGAVEIRNQPLFGSHLRKRRAAVIFFDPL